MARGENALNLRFTALFLHFRRNCKHILYDSQRCAIPGALLNSLSGCFWKWSLLPRKRWKVNQQSAKNFANKAEIKLHLVGDFICADDLCALRLAVCSFEEKTAKLRDICQTSQLEKIFSRKTSRRSVSKQLPMWKILVYCRRVLSTHYGTFFSSLLFHL